MWDIDRLQAMTAQDIKQLLVIPYPLLSSCPYNHSYAPGFPVYLNGELFGYPCGHCITDMIQSITAKNPGVEIRDSRKILYN